MADFTIFSRFLRNGTLFWGFFWPKWDTCLRTFAEKETHLGGTFPYALTCEYPPRAPTSHYGCSPVPIPLSLWASNRNPAPPGGFLETTIFGNLSHRAIEIRLPAKIPVLDKAVRALFLKMVAKFQQMSCFWYYFLYFDNFIQFYAWGYTI